MSKIDKGGTAFPAKDNYGYHLGMTLRDYFAAKAMQARINDSKLAPMWSFEDHADRAYKMADAMLKARKGEL